MNSWGLAHLIQHLELVRDALLHLADDTDDDDVWDAAQRLQDLVSDLRACLG